MTKSERLLSRVCDNEDGVTAVEFGLITIPFLTILLGTLDLGYNFYLQAALQSSLNEAARQGTVGGLTSTAIDQTIHRAANTVKTRRGTVAITRRSYRDFSRIDQPEKITNDLNSNTIVDQTGDCFDDENNNGTHDVSTASGSSSQGGGDDIVFYRVTMSVPRLFPFVGFLGVSPNYNLVVEQTVKNQPYALQDPISNVCLP